VPGLICHPGAQLVPPLPDPLPQGERENLEDHGSNNLKTASGFSPSPLVGEGEFGRSWF